MISSRRDSLFWTKTNCFIIKMKKIVNFSMFNLIENKNFNLIMLNNATIHILDSF